MTAVDVDVEGLRRLDSALGRYAERQAEALQGISAELERCEEAVRQRLRAAKELVDDARQRLSTCERWVGPDGERADCSGYHRALLDATEAYLVVLRAMDRVGNARSRWEGAARSHEAVLGSRVPALRTGLQRRIDSLEAYNSWSLETLHVTSLGRNGPLAPPAGGPETEVGRGSKEQLW